MGARGAVEQTTASNTKSSASIIERVFDLAKAGTNPRTEFIAGLTTFLTMVYIVFVNPQILGNTGMDKGEKSGEGAAAQMRSAGTVSRGYSSVLS